MEKKRRLILQEVEEVMKEERHIHIDALVAKVIEASRKWKDLSPAPYFGVTDVLSCIMYQLRNGAIYRKTNNPLILACKEDSPPSPPPLISLLSHTVTPVPPQVSEFCSVRKIPNNIGAVLEERPIFRTFRYPE
uniref:Uncharacterized protein n=1 Tax=Pyxicephalus adspersus TaxID=30357 RepID=A0AAV3AK02_PYXAD|nr:TPA: hypothetical protein GDO54_011571 [Pyxicephalus adspersus]